jgi:preprotein translocase SecE subunit
MAEVRKKKIEDKYNTASIKTNSIASKEKKSNKKEVINKNKSTKSSDKKEKKSLFTKFRIFCHGVKSEFEKVHWTSKENMVKYSIATIIFIIFFSVFFYLIDIIFALIQSLFS